MPSQMSKHNKHKRCMHKHNLFFTGTYLKNNVGRLGINAKALLLMLRNGPEVGFTLCSDELQSQGSPFVRTWVVRLLPQTWRIYSYHHVFFAGELPLC